MHLDHLRLGEPRALLGAGLPMTTDEQPRYSRAPVTERQLATAELDAKAARMRTLGFSYRQIARQLEFGSSASAHRAVKRALAEVVRDAGEELLKLELERMDAMLVQAIDVVDKSADPLVKLAGIDRVLKVSESRRRLLGMDAPTRRELRITDSTDAAIEQLAAEVAALEADTDEHEDA